MMTKIDYNISINNFVNSFPVCNIISGYSPHTSFNNSEHKLWMLRIYVKKLWKLFSKLLITLRKNGKKRNITGKKLRWGALDPSRPLRYVPFLIQETGGWCLFMVTVWIMKVVHIVSESINLYFDTNHVEPTSF